MKRPGRSGEDSRMKADLTAGASDFTGILLPTSLETKFGKAPLFGSNDFVQKG
jgi:hypothetical protein